MIWLLHQSKRRRGDKSSPADGRRSALGLSCSLNAARCGRRQLHSTTPLKNPCSKECTTWEEVGSTTEIDRCCGALLSLQ